MMGLQLVYGSYFHADAEAAITTDVLTNFNANKIAFSRVVRWNIEGTLLGSGPTDLAARQALLMAAYDAHYLDALLLDNSTGNVLQSLRNAGSLTGVRVMNPPSFVRGDGPEFATQRKYRITLEAEYEYAASPEIVEFRESVKMWGGGPLIAWVECVTGPAQKQTLKEQTTFKATQSGTAVGRTTKLTPPSPIWSGSLMANPEITIDSADRMGQSLRNSRTTWSYTFEDAAPLVALPNEWPLI